MHTKRILAVLIVVSLIVPTTALADVTGSPNLYASTSTNQFSPGEEGTLAVTLRNSGEVDSMSGAAAQSSSATTAVTTARAVRVNVDSGSAPITVKTGAQVVQGGSIPDGQAVPTQFQIAVDQDAKPGTYHLPVHVKYTYTSAVTNSGNQVTQTKQETLHVTITIKKEPRFEVVSSRANLPVGGSGPVTVRLENVGHATAHNAYVTLQSNNGALSTGSASSAAASQSAASQGAASSSGVSLGGSSTYIGDWKNGETRTITVQSSLASNAEVRSYALQAQVDYQNDNGNASQSGALVFGVTPNGKQSFDVRNAQDSLRVGQQGTLEGTIVNTGESTAHNAVAVLQLSQGANVKPAETEYRLGTIAPGDGSHFSFDLTIPPSASAGPRQYSVVVRYRNDGGDQQTSGSLDVPATVGGKQTFAVRDVNSTLRVGDTGKLSGYIVNTGESTVHNLVVNFQTQNPNINPDETQYAVGTLKPGEKAPFSFETDVTDSADAGPRQFSLTAQYRDGDNNLHQADSADVKANVAPARDSFGVKGVNATLEQGKDGSLYVTVTNDRNETLSDISAKLFVDSPLSTSNSEAFISKLGPGESQTVLFDLSVGGSAEAKTYPAKVDFKYDLPDGSSRLSKTYQVPIDVTEPSGNGGISPALIVGALIVLALAAGTYYLYRRR